MKFEQVARALARTKILATATLPQGVLKPLGLGVGSLVGAVALSGLGSIGLAAPAAHAQAAYGSYVGIGPAVGFSQGAAGEPSRTSGNIAVRYKFLEAPVSLRMQAIIGDNTALVPTVSYDVPLSWRTDAYVGAGISIVNGQTTTPVGNDTAFVIQPGIDHSLPNSNLVLFGNAIIAFDAYRNGGGSAVSVQAGVGMRF
jgi:hypothetical protein